MTCPNCGFQNPEGDRFCRMCGTQFNIGAAPAAGKVDQIQTAAAGVTSAPGRTPEQKKRLVTAILAVAVIVAALGVGLILLLSRKDSKSGGASPALQAEQTPGAPNADPSNPNATAPQSNPSPANTEPQSNPSPANTEPQSNPSPAGTEPQSEASSATPSAAPTEVRTEPPAPSTSTPPTALIGLRVDSKPSRTSYFVGEALDLSGMRLSAVYSDGSTLAVSDGVTCSPSTFTSAGTQTVTVRWKDQTTTFSVTVEEPKISRIEIASEPNRTYYYVGESLDAAGLVLTAVYTNGETQTVRSGFSCSPTSFQSTGRCAVTVSYGGKSADFYVTVEEVRLNWIEILSTPDVTYYNLGDHVDVSGLVLRAVYTDGTDKRVTSGFDIDPALLDETGYQTITVRYGNCDTSFQVYVEEPELIFYGDEYAHVTMNCWDSYWDLSRDMPFWAINLPSAGGPNGESVNWEIVEGGAYLRGDTIAAQQPGRIVARASCDVWGYPCTKDFVLDLEIYKTTTDINYLHTGPSLDYEVILNVPSNTTVYITETAWDPARRASNGNYYWYGKTTYNGRTGWIVIS